MTERLHFHTVARNKVIALLTQNSIKKDLFTIAGHMKLLEINVKHATLISGKLRNMSKRC